MIRTRIGGDICSDAGGYSVKAEMGAMSEFKDVLHACNAGEYFDLPQLVVVGDQSSGKSSVLEGLTGLRVMYSLRNAYYVSSITRGKDNDIDNSEQKQLPR